jgi:hypothetical protein
LANLHGIEPCLCEALETCRIHMLRLKLVAVGATQRPRRADDGAHGAMRLPHGLRLRLKADREQPSPKPFGIAMRVTSRVVRAAAKEKPANLSAAGFVCPKAICRVSERVLLATHISQTSAGCNAGDLLRLPRVMLAPERALHGAEGNVLRT